MSSDSQETRPRQFRDRSTEQVIDPEDYNRTQRFKEIHTARQRIADFVTDMEMPDEGGDQFYLRETSRLAYLVALYILELEPLIVQSDIEDGELVPDSSKYSSLRDFAMKMGIQYTKDGTRPPSPPTVMAIYSAANRFYARVGMDLEMEDGNNEADADYSDILDGDDA